MGTCKRWWIAVIALVCASGVRSQTFLGIDRFDEREDHGVWSRAHQKGLDVVAAGSVLVLAFAEGTETRIGRTAWQAMDAALMSAAATEAVKRVTGRPRPSQDRNPDVWFAGSRDRSFPSGETAMIASVVTPFVMQYHDDVPAVWALAALPVYMGRARMTSQGHWLTDVLAGGAVGVAMGVYASRRDVPLVLSVSGRSAFVGLRYRF